MVLSYDLFVRLGPRIEVGRMGCRCSCILSLAGSAVGSIADDCRPRIVELLWIEGAEQAEPECFLLLLGAMCPALI